MKRIFCAGFLCALLLGLFACGEAEPEAKITAAGATALAAAATEAPMADTRAYAPIIAAYSGFLRGADVDVDGATAAFLRAAGTPEAFSYQMESSLFELSLDGKESLGYSVYDINGDGVPELIVRSEDFFTIYSIFTLRGGKPVLLGAYWSRSRCMLAANGTLYYDGSSGADDSVSLILTLPPVGTAFEEREADPAESGLHNPMILDFTPIT